MEHRDAELLLADAEHGRLDPGVAAELATHVAACDECRAWRDTYALLRRAAGTGSGHPSSDALARYAVSPPGLPGPEREALTTHLASCDTCRQELALVQGALAASRDAAPSPPRRRALLLPLAVAASLALAAAAGLLYTELLNLRGDLRSVQGWSGVVVPVLIEDATRGGGEAELVASGNQPFGLFAVRMDTAGAADAAPVVFEVRDEGGALRWSGSMTAGDARDRAARDGAVFLQVPLPGLDSGRYLFVASLAGPDPRRLLERGFTVRRTTPARHF